MHRRCGEGEDLTPLLFVWEAVGPFQTEGPLTERSVALRALRLSLRRPGLGPVTLGWFTTLQSRHLFVQERASSPGRGESWAGNTYRPPERWPKVGARLWPLPDEDAPWCLAEGRLQSPRERTPPRVSGLTA